MAKNSCNESLLIPLTPPLASWLDFLCLIMQQARTQELGSFSENDWIWSWVDVSTQDFFILCLDFLLFGRSLFFLYDHLVFFCLDIQYCFVFLRISAAVYPLVLFKKFFPYSTALFSCLNIYNFNF